jgi:hypothetical protein
MEIFEKKCGENLTIDQLIEVFKNEPLKFKPGSQYSYSNSNVRYKIKIFFIIKNFSLVYFIGFNYRKSNWKIL